MVYLLSNSLLRDSYIESYEYFLKRYGKSLKVIYPKKTFGVKRLGMFFAILIIPFKANVIIENIHYGAIALWLRPDLRVTHIPRGAGTFKVGWRDTSQLNLLTRIKLIRRNRIVVCSKIFRDYMSSQEATKNDKYRIAHEPLVIEGSQSKKRRNVDLVALSECWQKDDVDRFARSLKLLNPKISYHPVLKLNPCDNIDMNAVRSIYTDCTTLAIYGFVLGLNVYIFRERQTSERRLFRKQSDFFKGINGYEGNPQLSSPNFYLETPDASVLYAAIFDE